MNVNGGEEERKGKCLLTTHYHWKRNNHSKHSPFLRSHHHQGDHTGAGVQQQQVSIFI